VDPGAVGHAEKDITRLQSTLLTDYTVCRRTRGKGVLSGEQALQLGAAGPTLRGSGVAQDARQENYAAYGGLEFAPVTEPDGDSWSRSAVRFRETLQSIDLVRQAIARMPGGEVFAPSKAKPQGEVTMRVEQPRGELFYYIKATARKTWTGFASAPRRSPTSRRFWPCCRASNWPMCPWWSCPSTRASVAPNAKRRSAVPCSP
jgi:Ni,Fe-hydrogenase III large subunit